MILPILLLASGCTNQKAYNTLINYVTSVNLPEQDEGVAYRFSEGLSSYWKDGLAGYINKAGNIVIKPQYSYTGFFKDGLACVEKGGLHGYIDKTGHVVIPIQYMDARDFVEGVGNVFDGNKWFLIDRDGKYLSDFNYSLTGQANPIYIDGGYSTYVERGLYGYVNRTGKLAIPAQFEKAGPMSNGYAFVTKQGRTMIIDRTGQNAFPDREIRKADDRFLNGLAMVTLEDDTYVGKSMVIDDKGNFVFEVPTECGDQLYLNEGLIHYRDPKTKKWGCLDVKGTVVIPPVLDDISFSWDGVMETYLGSEIPFYVKNPVWQAE